MKIGAWAVLVLAAASAGRPLLFEIRDPGAPVEVLSVTVSGPDSSPGAKVPAIPEGSAFDLVVTGRKHGALEEGVVFRAEIRGSGPAIVTEFPTGLADAPLGSAVVESFSFSVPALRYSGNATLEIALSEPDRDPRVLYRGPVRILPRIHPSSLDPEILRREFGRDARPLGVAFRLGRGADLVVPLPEDGSLIGGLAVASRTDHHPHFQQGAAVARVTLLRAGEPVAAAVIAAGVSTSLANYDAYPTGTLPSKKIAVLESRDSGRGYAIHTYAGRLAWGSPVAADAIRFEYLPDEGILEVRDLALLPGDDR